MNSATDQLVRSILQKESLEQCNVQELQQLSARYPFFAPVQLLLAKKLQPVDPGQYKVSFEKASLLFHDPLWLRNLLSEAGDVVIQNNEASFVSPSLPAEVIEKEPEPEIESETEREREPEPAIKIPGLKIEAIDPAKTGLLFEPYHTIDYFASQGIKFKEEEKPKDNFGQQLKSFTEWLKVLKVTPISEIVQHSDINTEQKVEQLAGQSLQDNEVVTETMAEVWEKQGNSEKAIDIYYKLSLLEPSKRAYFAAKIEELKKIN